MFKNFLKVAFRNVSRYKGFSLINIAGLTLGMAACLLIGLFVQDEYSYDKFMPGGDSVYRIYNHYTDNNEEADRAVAPPVFATTLKQEYPEIEAVTRVMALPQVKRLFAAGNHKFYESSGLLVDSTFFSVFPLSFTHGVSVGSLDDRSSIVLSEEMAERFFGKQDPVGKQITLDQQPLLVKGVFQKNAKFHLQFNYLIPISAAQLPAQRMQSWVWQQFYNYAKLKNGTDVPALQAKFQKLVKERSAPFMNSKHGGNKPVFQRLADIHLYAANFKFDIPSHGNITYVPGFNHHCHFHLAYCLFKFCKPCYGKIHAKGKRSGCAQKHWRGPATNCASIYWRNRFTQLYQYRVLGYAGEDVAALAQPVYRQAYLHKPDDRPWHIGPVAFTRPGYRCFCGLLPGAGFVGI
jgi:putative ABC transport system permease protein